MEQCRQCLANPADPRRSRCDFNSLLPTAGWLDGLAAFAGRGGRPLPIGAGSNRLLRSVGELDRGLEDQPRHIGSLAAVFADYHDLVVARPEMRVEWNDLDRLPVVFSRRLAAVDQQSILVVACDHGHAAGWRR